MKRSYLFITAAALSFLALGMIFFAWQRSFLLVQWVGSPHIFSASSAAASKSVSLYYYQEKRLINEPTSLVWEDDLLANISQVVNRWLLMMHQEGLLSEVLLKSALITEQGRLYLSFDKNPLEKECSLDRKARFIEALLKTVKGVFSSVQEVFFLVNHSPLKDAHLDFSVAWPIDGFLETAGQ